MDAAARKRMFQAIDQLPAEKLGDHAHVRLVLQRASVPLAAEGVFSVTTEDFDEDGKIKEPKPVQGKPPTDEEFESYAAMLMEEFCPGYGEAA